jgi:hypothetical protein
MEISPASLIVRAPSRAAQYVRMSTEHQQYSPENQLDVIRQYAADHNMDIVPVDEGMALGVLRRLSFPQSQYRFSSGLRSRMDDGLFTPVQTCGDGCYSVLVLALQYFACITIV